MKNSNLLLLMNFSNVKNTNLRFVTEQLHEILIISLRLSLQQTLNTIDIQRNRKPTKLWKCYIPVSLKIGLISFHNATGCRAAYFNRSFVGGCRSTRWQHICYYTRDRISFIYTYCPYSFMLYNERLDKTTSRHKM